MQKLLGPARETGILASMPHKNPFRTLSSEHPFVDPRIAIRRDRFALDDGFEGVHIVVEIPEAVCIVPVTTDGRILLLRQWRYTTQDLMWEVPAGRMHSGETVLESATRELLEETGHRAGRWAPLGEFHPLAGISDHKGHLLAALDCIPVSGQQLEPTERIEVVPCRRPEVLDLFTSFAIRDGFAVAALSRFLLKFPA